MHYSAICKCSGTEALIMDAFGNIQREIWCECNVKVTEAGTGAYR
jgi:hypothetical protein